MDRIRIWLIALGPSLALAAMFAIMTVMVLLN
jgi:hypothetical protein